MRLTRSDFPDDFVFGASTSAYQIEGHAQGGAGPTHWDSFAATPGNVAGAQNGDMACDHLNRWAEDLDLVKGANLDAYRFSTSWARVMPEGRGTVNAEGLDFYERLVDGCLERGIKPLMTLHHWELPSALADLGGWTNRDIAGWFADFTHVMAERLGDRVWAAAPINELYCIAWLGHFSGAHAPGLRDVRAFARSMHHALLAHGRSIEAMRAAGMSNLGGVFNFEYVSPADDSPESAAATRLQDALHNQAYISAVFNKRYPQLVTDALEPHLPAGWQDDFDTIGAPLDWCGVNYYTRRLVRATGGPWPGFDQPPGPLEKTQLGWEIYPDGLEAFLRRVHEGYTRDLPIYVTESGLSLDDRLQGGAVNDPRRIAYIEDHLDRARRALDGGVPLKGFFHWSLLDNYEWSEGYGPRFGLVHVDYNTQTRTPKASYHALGRALAK